MFVNYPLLNLVHHLVVLLVVVQAVVDTQVVVVSVVELAVEVEEVEEVELEFYAGWNEANKVVLLDEWDNFEVNRVYRLNIETYPKIQSDNNVVVLPTIIFYLDGDEAGRLQGNMQFKLETTTEELNKMVEEIYNEDKFN